MSIALVWLKRDLRLSDHEPLVLAAQTRLPVVLFYCFEDIQVNDSHYKDRHWRFVAQSLADIGKKIPIPALWITQGDLTTHLNHIHELHGIGALFSHQEVGLANTFSRDKAVNQWCIENKVKWHESNYAAVIRGLTNRSEWDKHWDSVMRSPTQDFDLSQVNWYQQPLAIENSQSSDNEEVLQRWLPVDNSKDECSAESLFQKGGESEAWRTLASFFEQRGKSYAYSLSSPSLSQQHCSRLSAYLAWGNISLKQVYQYLLQHWQVPGWRRSLVALSSRLHWHCHFIQKFESESRMEFEPVNKGYQDLPRSSGDIQQRHLTAWKTGQTGYPMVDACMRCLHTTGYINFRMRAMLVSFLCHHLAIDWRLGVKHLASLFLDFEPGIHYSQFQMQAGITGINTIRIYNPVKQGEEKDPKGEFVRAWIPELNEVPSELIHTPWQLTPMEQMMYGLSIGKTYPAPIVDIKESYKHAQQLLWSWRKKPSVKREAQRLLAMHVRPNT